MTHHLQLPTSDALTPAWIVCAWPTVLWQARAAPELQLIHLGTRVLSSRDATCRCTGQTLWGETCGDRAAGVAWDWVELQRGVVAMADPFGLVTNLQLLDDLGEALSAPAMALRLNALVHGLPWQSEVQRALQCQDA